MASVIALPSTILCIDRAQADEYYLFNNFYLHLYRYNRERNK